MQLLQLLRGDLSEFTPIPFWFLNDDLDKAELTRQLEDFHAKGVDGVVVHPRIGIPRSTAYLSDAYFDAIEHIVATAARLGMKIVLYDEAMYPSGTAHGEVVRQNPAFASLGLFCTQVAEGKVIAALPNGSFLVQKHCGGTIRGIHFGEDDGEPDAPPSADILNPDAVKCFLSLTHDAYYKRLQAYFGKCIIGFFTDEPCVLGRNTAGCFAWTDGLEQDILAAGGTLEDLQALFAGQENSTTRLYHKAVKKRLCEVYYHGLSAWCEAHSIALMGHPEKSDDIDEELFFHVPGQDLILRRVAPETGGLSGMDSVQAKCSADAARHTGKRRNANECFGVCGRSAWHFPCADRKWMLDWLGVRGVNLFIPHAFYYSLRDARKDERPPDVGPNDITWPHYRLWSDYMKRLSFLMTDAKNCACVGVACESGAMPYDEVAALYENQIEFNYVPRTLRDLHGYTYTHTLENAFEAPRDFVAHTPVPALRVSHLIKDGVHVYVCVNEGQTALDITASVRAQGTVLHYDLWRDALYRAGTHDAFRLRLEPYESAALLLDETGAVSAPNLVQWRAIFPQFSLMQESGNTKTYRATLTLAETDGTEVLCVEADEMAEWTVNGSFAGVSFWNTHRCDAAPFLRVGENEIVLRVTGSTSNLYGERVAFGVRQG